MRDEGILADLAPVYATVLRMLDERRPPAEVSEAAGIPLEALDATITIACAKYEALAGADMSMSTPDDDDRAESSRDLDDLVPGPAD